MILRICNTILFYASRKEKGMAVFCVTRSLDDFCFGKLVLSIHEQMIQVNIETETDAGHLELV